MRYNILLQARPPTGLAIENIPVACCTVWKQQQARWPSVRYVLFDLFTASPLAVTEEQLSCTVFFYVWRKKF